MKSYSSFFIRCRIVHDGAGERFVFDIEHIQQGAQIRTQSPAEAIDWIITRSRTEREATDSEEMPGKTE
jgi:hypothetical protein